MRGFVKPPSRPDEDIGTPSPREDAGRGRQRGATAAYRDGVKRKPPRLRVRLGAMALGVVLVAGSVGWIWWSVQTSSQHSGFGSLLEDVVRLQPANYRGTGLVCPDVIAISPRPGFVATVRVEAELLAHVLAEFDRTESRYEGMMICEGVYRRGVWAPTHERANMSVILNERIAYAITLLHHPYELYAGEIRKHLATAPRQPQPGSWMNADFLAHGETESSRVLWSGYLVNAATVVGVVVMGWGAWGTMGAITVMRRARAGRCMWCGYDLAGLGAEVRVCPECGAERE